MKSYETCLTIAIVLFNSVHRCFRLVNKIRIKDIELVSLYNLRWRVIMIIMGLVIFIPLVSGMNPIEVLGFSWPIFVMPPVHLEGKRCQKVSLT